MIFSLIGDLRMKIALYLESKLGAPAEQIIIIMTMASVIPFSFLNYVIHNRQARLLYSLIIGFIFHYSIYGIKSIHTIIGTIGSYLYIYFYGRKFSPFYLLIASMAHLSILNIIRMIVDFGGWSIDDISTIYMVEVAKFSSFCFSYSDGAIPPDQIKSTRLREKRIVEMPSLLEYASYIYFYPTTLVGPFIEFKDFINFIEEKDCYKNLTSKMKYILYQGTEKFLIAICFIVFFALYSDKYPMYALGTKEFRQNYPKWWMRLLYSYACGPIGRSKYYIAWALTYSSLIFSGMAYGETVENGQVIPNVEKGSYGSIRYNELGMNPRLKMTYWNMSIHFWLKYNVYVRVLGSKGPLGNNKVMASFITFIFSAIWHGFYASYYVSFVLIYLFEQNGEFLNEIGFYKYVDAHMLLWPITTLKTTFFYNMIGSIFYCLEIRTTKEILINFYGLPANAIIIFYIFSLIYRFSFMKKKKKNTDDKEKLKEKNDNATKEKNKKTE